jgi:protein RecA
MKPRFKKSAGGSYFGAPASALEFIPSGSKLLDCVLGGGWPLGRIANIVGDKSTGKTLLAIEACANFARAYPSGYVWYNEAEAAFDKGYAAALGLPAKRIELVEDCNTVEEFFDHLSGVIKEEGAGSHGLYILDSLDSLSDTAEMKRGIDEGSYGAQKAKKMSELFRRTVRELKKTNIHLMIISQVRDAIGVTFGSKHARTGGRAMDFYASQVLFLAQVGSIKRTIDKVMRPVGVNIRAKAKKNKIALPSRECDFSILFGFGVDDISSGLEWLASIDKIHDFKDLTKERLSRYLSKLSLASEEELMAVREEVDALIVRHWYRIEKDFLPTRRKYA